MSGLAGAPGNGGPAEDGRGGYLAYVIFGALGLVALAIVVVCAFVVIGITSAGDSATSATAERAAQLRKLPIYWTVRRGDTYGRIATRTGLTVEELQAFNPSLDAARIQPGQRLKLRAKVPPPKPRPPGPKWVTVRTGDSFSSIAARRDTLVARLRRLNPKLKATALQPGDRVRLR